jgi:hypothetical protein
LNFVVTVLESVVLALDDRIDAIVDIRTGLVGLEPEDDGTTSSFRDDNYPNWGDDAMVVLSCTKHYGKSGDSSRGTGT